MDEAKRGFKTKWNWGAFMLSLPYAIGVKAYLALLVLVPVLNFVWVFVSGAMGEKWALSNGEYRDNEEFRKVMDSWNRAGFVMFIIAIIAGVLWFAVFGAVVGAILSNLK